MRSSAEEILHEDARDLNAQEELEPLERVAACAHHLLELINYIRPVEIEAGRMGHSVETYRIAPLVVR